MDGESIAAWITQIGIVPALFAYTLINMKQSLDKNTQVMNKLLMKMGGDISE